MDTEATRSRLTSASVTEEEAFIRRLRDGDRSALDELWQRFGARLLGYAATRLGGDEDLAEDVIVQTLAAAIRSIRSFDPRRSSLSAWMYGVARRIIDGELRSQRKRSAVPASAMVTFNEAMGGEPRQHLEHDLPSRLEAQRQVRVLASALSAAEMEVLVLHFVDEFSVKEMAQIMGRSWRAVDSLLHRAKQKARGRLAQDGE